MNHFIKTKRYFSRVVLINSKTEKVLLLLNKQRNRWELPGGKKERWESARQAAIRETLEETGIKIHPEQFTCIKVLSITIEGTRWTGFFYLAESFTKKKAFKQIKDEHSKSKWVTLAESWNLPQIPILTSCIIKKALY